MEKTVIVIRFWIYSIIFSSIIWHQMSITSERFLVCSIVSLIVCPVCFGSTDLRSFNACILYWSWILMTYPYWGIIVLMPPLINSHTEGILDTLCNICIYSMQASLWHDSILSEIFICLKAIIANHGDISGLNWSVDRFEESYKVIRNVSIIALCCIKWFHTCIENFTRLKMKVILEKSSLKKNIVFPIKLLCLDITFNIFIFHMMSICQAFCCHVKHQPIALAVWLGTW